MRKIKYSKYTNFAYWHKHSHKRMELGISPQVGTV